MKLKCPIPQCGCDNSIDATECAACGTRLQSYYRLLLMPDELFNRGLTFAQSGNFQQAERCLQTALLLNNRDVEAMLLLAEIQALQGNATAASGTLGQVVEKGTTDERLQKSIAELQSIMQATHTKKLQAVPAATKMATFTQQSKSSGLSKGKKKKKRK